MLTGHRRLSPRLRQEVERDCVDERRSSASTTETKERKKIYGRWLVSHPLQRSQFLQRRRQHLPLVVLPLPQRRLCRLNRPPTPPLFHPPLPLQDRENLPLPPQIEPHYPFLRNKGEVRTRKQQPRPERVSVRSKARQRRKAGGTDGREGKVEVGELFAEEHRFGFRVVGGEDEADEGERVGEEGVKKGGGEVYEAGHAESLRAADENGGVKTSLASRTEEEKKTKWRVMSNVLGSFRVELLKAAHDERIRFAQLLLRNLSTSLNLPLVELKQDRKKLSMRMNRRPVPSFRRRVRVGVPDI